MKYQKLVLYTYLAIGLYCVTVTMFHPYSLFLNKLIPTIGIAILICVGYYIDAQRVLNKVDTNKKYDTNENNFGKKTEIEQKQTLEEKFSILNKKIETLKSYSSKAPNYRELQLQLLCNEYQFGQGMIFDKISKNNSLFLKRTATFAYSVDEEQTNEIEWGLDITGQAAKNGEFIYLDNVPKGHLQIASGLGISNPSVLIIAPFKENEETVGVVELAGFQAFDANELQYIKKSIQVLFS